MKKPFFSNLSPIHQIVYVLLNTWIIGPPPMCECIKKNCVKNNTIENINRKLTNHCQISFPLS